MPAGSRYGLESNGILDIGGTDTANLPGTATGVVKTGGQILSSPGNFTPVASIPQAILQIAVALYHLGNSNLRGACILLGEGTNKLSRYEASYAGIDVDKLLDDSVALLLPLQQQEVALPLLPKISLTIDT